MTHANARIYHLLAQEVADVDGQISAKQVCEAFDALELELERLRAGILNNAATLVKWAIAAGGHTPSAIIAGHLRELVESHEN